MSRYGVVEGDDLTRVDVRDPVAVSVITAALTVAALVWAAVWWLGV